MAPTRPLPDLPTPPEAGKDARGPGAGKDAGTRGDGAGRDARGPGPEATVAWLVFAAFAALFAATAGARGYSVDGDFAYRLARDAVARGPVEAAQAQRELLKRWGIGLPIAGMPFVALGEALADHLPPANSVTLDDVPGAAGALVVPLASLPPVSLDVANAPGDAPSMTVPVPPSSGPLEALTLVTSVAYGRDLPDGTVVATVTLLDGALRPVAGPYPLRAGLDTAEWSWGDPSAPPAAHGKAPIAGTWDGNSGAHHFRAALPVAGVLAETVRIEATSPTGRLIVGAVIASTARGPLVLTAPSPGGAALTADRLTRAAFGFANVLPGAATVALMVPVARSFGATIRAAIALAVATGLATLAWPYARLDFSEGLAAALATGALATRLLASRAATAHGAITLNLAAGALAFGAGITKYTALWFAPLVAIDALLRPGVLARWRVVALFGTPAAILAAGALVSGFAAPRVISELAGGLARGWLGLPPHVGVASLLVSSGKGLAWYAPPLVLAAIGAVPFVRRHRSAAFLPVATTLAYLVTFGSKGNWHGGGWGPRYVVPMVPFAMAMALPMLAVATGPASRWRTAARATVLVAIVAGFGVNVLGTLKHPNAWTIMFRDHVAPRLEAYGTAVGGPLARAYVQHFREAKASSELLRPPGEPVGLHGSPLPARGLGHLIDRDSPLIVKVWPRISGRFALTLYFANYDGPPDVPRHQLVTVVDAVEARTVRIDAFAAGAYATWVVDAITGDPVVIAIHDSGRAFPVLTGLFFDPAPPGKRPFPTLDFDTRGAWVGRYGSDGAILPAYEMGPRDAGALPPYVEAITGGTPVWVDTGELERSEAALLYAPGFSPIVAHAWLLGNDLVANAFPRDAALRQKALASPPWRYVHGLDVHSPHPEYGLGVDLWPFAFRDWFGGRPGVMAAVWAVEGTFAATAAMALGALARAWQRASPTGPAR